MLLIYGLLFLAVCLFSLVVFWHSQVVPQPLVHLINKADPPAYGQRILVLAPHPDDETLGAAGYILSALRRGAEVWVVLVTDGNKRGQNRRRTKEFQRACAVLGVPSGNLIYWHYPDGYLRANHQKGLQRHLHRAIGRIKPRVIVAPHCSDSHRDHVAVSRAAKAVARQDRLVVYQYLIHFHRFPAPRGYLFDDYLLPPLSLALNEDWRVFQLSSVDREIKEEALRVYRSQLRFRVIRDLLLSFLRRNELFSVIDYS